MQRRRFGWFSAMALLGAIGACAAFWWAGRDRSRAHDFAVAAHAPAFRSDSGVVGGDLQSVRARARLGARNPALPDGESGIGKDSLPALDANLRAILAELEARAAAGDARATCRLATDLDLCRSRSALSDTIEHQVTRAAESTPGSWEESRDSEFAARLQARRERADRICGEIGPNEERLAWKYLLRSALDGNDAAAVRLLVHPPLSSSDFLTDLDGWTAFKAHSAGLLRRLIDHGDPMGLFIAMGLYAGTDRLDGGTNAGIPPNPYRAMVYGTALQRIVDPRSRLLIKGVANETARSLNAGQIARARLEGEALHVSTIAGRPLLDVFAITYPDASVDICD